MGLRNLTPGMALAMAIGAASPVAGVAQVAPLPDLPAIVAPNSGVPVQRSPRYAPLGRVMPPPAPLPPPAPSLPAASPTSLAGPPAAQVAVAPPVAAALPAHRPKVQYEAGQLSIQADNASLNQILRDIARLTGLKITGGVTDERVFGNYGPADVQSVLSMLLNGTGSNMMLVENAGDKPLDLVLTPRQGGVTPPNPMAGQDVSDDPDPADLPPQRNGEPQRAVEQQTMHPAVIVPPGNFPVIDPGSAPPAAAIAPPEGTTTQQSPNGVSTPQQIYDQLIKLQQQKAKTPQ